MRPRLSLRPLFRLLAGLAQRVQYRRRSGRGISLLRFRLRLPISGRLRRNGVGDFNPLFLSRLFQLRWPEISNTFAFSPQLRPQPRGYQPRVTLQNFD